MSPAAKDIKKALFDKGLERKFRPAMFWQGEAVSTLEIINVLGRWEDASQWGTRTEFAENVSEKDDSLDQAKTRKRYDTAQRLGMVEIVAFQMNVPKLPFTNAALAATAGRTVEDFVEPPSMAAINVVYDALAQSKSSLVPPKVVNERRNSFLTADGAFAADAFQGALSKGMAIVVWAQATLYFFYACGFAAFVRVILDVLGGETAWS